MDVTTDTLDSLAARIDGLDLTEEEQAILDGILARAATAGGEVEGFAFVGFDDHDVTDDWLSLPLAGRLAGGLGIIAVELDAGRK